MNSLIEYLEDYDGWYHDAMLLECVPGPFKYIDPSYKDSLINLADRYAELTKRRMALLETHAPKTSEIKWVR